MQIYKTLDEVLNKDEDLASFIEKRDIIYVKPNWCDIVPPPATTPISTVEKVLAKIRELGKTGVVVETDKVTNSANARARKLGFKGDVMNVTELKDSTCAATVVLPDREVKLFIGDMAGKTGIINLPLIKAADVPPWFTCAKKNLFGLACVKNKGKLHKYFPQLLEEIARIYDGKIYSIVDGVVGMEGKGSPVKGKPVRFNPEFWIAGGDLSEIDNVVSTVFFPFSNPRRSQLMDIPNITLMLHQRPLEPCVVDIAKRFYLFVWSNLDNHLLKPVLWWKQRKYLK